MSYPGFLSPSTNLSADVSTQRGVNDFSYVLNTGGGSSTGSSLTSPATILNTTVSDPTSLTFQGPSSYATPAVIQLKADTPLASEILEFSTSNHAVVVTGAPFIVRDGTATTNIITDPVYNGIVAAGSSIKFGNTFNIEKSGTGPSYFAVDTVAGTVTSNAPLSVFDPTLVGNNALTLSRTDPTTSNISQSVASAGRLTIGSSAAYNATLEVVDNGTQSYVVVGGNGANGLYLNGTSTNLTYVATTAATNTNGQLVLGASAGATNTVNLTDTTMTVDQVLTLNQPPVTIYGAATILAPGTHGGGVNATINVSTYADGLWLFITKPSVTSDQTTYNAMTSGTIYIKNGVVAGGGYIGVAGGSGASIQTQVVVPGNTFNVINSTGNNIYYGAYLYQLSGVIPNL